MLITADIARNRDLDFIERFGSDADQVSAYRYAWRNSAPRFSTVCIADDRSKRKPTVAELEHLAAWGFTVADDGSVSA